MFTPLRTTLIYSATLVVLLGTATTCSAMSYFSSLFSAQTASVPQEQPLSEDFLAKINGLRSSERYNKLDLIIDNDLKGSLPSNFLDWMQTKIEQKKDRWCMFRFIRNSAALKYNRATPGSKFYKQTMVYVIAHLILITEDIASLISVPHQKVADLTESYILFRDLYKKWYTEAFISEKIDFNEVKKSALTWLTQREKLSNPCPYWIVGATADHTPQRLGNIIFPNVDPDDINLCRNHFLAQLFASCQAQSFSEIATVLEDINNWETFFNHDFFKLNLKTIADIRHISLKQTPNKDSATSAVKKDEKKADQPATITVVSVSASSSMNGSGSAAASSSSSTSAAVNSASVGANGTVSVGSMGGLINTVVALQMAKRTETHVSAATTGTHKQTTTNPTQPIA